MPQNALPKWWPESDAIYDIEKTWEQNLIAGPHFTAEFPPRTKAAPSEWQTLLGHRIASPVGIAAGPLLNSQWVITAGRLGFDVLTYKTVRSHSHPSHPLPNVLFVDRDQPLNQGALPSALFSRQTPPACIGTISITNSFGNPSMGPDYLQQDIAAAKAGLSTGQLLVVSVFGTDLPERGMVEDFAYTAKMVVEAGAPVVEANFSCPNLLKAGGATFSDPEMTARIAKAIRGEIGDVPLIIKVGAYPSMDQMREVFISAAKAGVQAISGINTISMKVQKQDGAPALGPNRPTSGICGNAIREEGFKFIRRAREIIVAEKLNLELIGVGGMTSPEHVASGLSAGADVVQVATGFMWDPLLAARFHQSGACVA